MGVLPVGIAFYVVNWKRNLNKSKPNLEQIVLLTCGKSYLKVDEISSYTDNEAFRAYDWL